MATTMDARAESRIDLPDGSATWMSELALLDEHLAAALRTADEATLRAVTARAALVSLETAGLAHVPSLQPSLVALRSGGHALAPYDREDHMAELTVSVPMTIAEAIPDDDSHWEAAPQQQYAVDALLATTWPDPLRAAAEALTCAAVVHGPDYREALAAARAGIL